MKRFPSFKKSVIVEQVLKPYPTHPLKAWKPWTLHPAVLSMAALFTAVLAGLIGLTLVQNNKQGALAILSGPSGFSESQIFVFRYLPITVIVLFSMSWSWIDLDVKRIEPWLQLSQHDGALAQDSVLLHYPVDFLPFVPYKAARCRQWAVFSASIIMVFVVWAVTPLQNAILNNNIVSLTHPVALSLSPAQASLGLQNPEPSMDAFNTAYGILWLGQSMPPFTTPKYTLAPFHAAQPVSMPNANQTLSATTTMYYTDLDCKAPAAVSVDQSTRKVSFDDGEGCLATAILSYPDVINNGQFAPSYIGYYNSSFVRASLQAAGCGDGSVHKFLAVWKLASDAPPDFGDPTNATALFCTPTYYMQQVDATVSLPEHSIVTATPLGPQMPLPADKFNVSLFEYLLTSGTPPSFNATARQDIIDGTVLHQDARLQNMSLSYVGFVGQMIGFAVGTTHQATEEYLQPNRLAGAFRDAHQILFAFAMQNVLGPHTEDTAVTGTLKSTVAAVTVEPVFAWLVIALLILIVGFTAFLLFATFHKISKLSCDPDSLGEVMKISCNSMVQQLFSAHDSSSDEYLADTLHTARLGITSDEDGKSSLSLLALPLLDGATPSMKPKLKGSEHGEHLVRPMEYSLAIGIPVCVCLVGVIAGLVLLHDQSITQNGIRLPVSNTFAQQLILNYLPSAMATILEPYWVLLSRLGCAMQPMEELQNGAAQARRSLQLNYTSLPPQLVFFHALGSRHFLLAALSLTAVLANLLTVSLSGLFTQQAVFQSQSWPLQPTYQPAFRFVVDGKATSASFLFLSTFNPFDPVYIPLANLTNQTDLPAWTTDEFFFLPLQFETTLPDNGGLKLDFQSRGYGLDVECNELTAAPSKAMYSLSINANAAIANFTTHHEQGDGTTIDCVLDNEVAGESMILLGDPTGRKALEVMNTMTGSPDSTNLTEANDFCRPLIVKGWLRANMSFPENVSTSASDALSPSNEASTEATMMACSLSFKSAQFNLTTSPTGKILQSTQVSPSTRANAPDFSYAIQFVAGALEPHGTSWHNDTLAADFLNYLILQLRGSRSFLNATLPPPTLAEASSATSNILKRLFTNQMSSMTALLALAPPETPPVPAQVQTLERRVFMSEPLYRISIAILSWNLVVAIVLYVRAPRAFLPRLPTSIASQIAYFAGSHVIDDVQRAGGDLRELDERGYRYGYGKYIGRDGWTHTGIERVPFVTKVEGGEGWVYGLRRRLRLAR